MVGRARSRLIAAAVATARWGLGRPTARPATLLARAAHRALASGRPGGGRLSELQVVEHTDVALHGGVLEPASPSELQAPTAWNAPGARTVELPGRPIGWSLLEDVELNDTSLVRVGGSLVGATGLLGDVRRGLRLKGPGMVAHRKERVLVEHPLRPASVAEGIRLCGFGSGNWYHWLVEILPTALLIDRLPVELRSGPLLVPAAVEHARSWREALDVVAPDRAWVAVPRDSTVSVDRMVWIDPAVNGPRTLRDDAPMELDLLAPSLPLLARLRTTVLERLGIEAQVHPGRRVLIVRPSDAKRSANQDELIAVARHRGFETVDPGSLSFSDQVRLFAGAEVVVGGWGAAWSSMMFAAPQTRGLMWAPAPFAAWPLFSNLAPVSGMRLRHLWVEVGARTMVGANKAPQHVPPDEFAAAIDAIL